MKKLLLALLTLALAFSAFACGETYTEVAKEDYVATMTDFVGEEAELTAAEITGNFRVFVKMSESNEGSFSTEFISKGTGDEFHATGSVTLAFDKDNKVTGANMSMTMTSIEDGTASVNSVEVVIESYSKAITFPNLSDYE